MLISGNPYVMINHVNDMEIIMTAVCCIKGCDSVVLAMGLCVNHYRMTRKHGSPVAERPLSAINRTVPVEQRFWNAVNKVDAGCWEWTASRDRDGYGSFRAEIHGIQVTKAHRYSYILHTGEVISPNLVVMHSCDNPCCVNPAHLSSGTSAQNTADMVAKNRHRGAGRIAQAAKVSRLSDDDVRAILRDPRRYADIAKDFGIHKQHVLALKARTTRGWVQIDPAEIVRSSRGVGGAARSKSLSDDDVRAIRASPEKGVTLAQRYGVSSATICDIQKRRSWKHIPDTEAARS